MGGFDRVLVDAPCSGSGTWRRNPDGRLRSQGIHGNPEVDSDTTFTAVMEKRV